MTCAAATVPEQEQGWTREEGEDDSRQMRHSSGDESKALAWAAAVEQRPCSAASPASAVEAAVASPAAAGRGGGIGGGRGVGRRRGRGVGDRDGRAWGGRGEGGRVCTPPATPPSTLSPPTPAPAGGRLPAPGPPTIHHAPRPPAHRDGWRWRRKGRAVRGARARERERGSSREPGAAPAAFAGPAIDGGRRPTTRRAPAAPLPPPTVLFLTPQANVVRTTKYTPWTFLPKVWEREERARGGADGARPQHLNPSTPPPSHPRACLSSFAAWPTSTFSSSPPCPSPRSRRCRRSRTSRPWSPSSRCPSSKRAWRTPNGRARMPRWGEGRGGVDGGGGGALSRRPAARAAPR